MNDQELNILFEQSARRQKAVEQINLEVMRTVRSDMRAKRIRKWARLIALCFGVPMLIVLYVFALVTYLPDMPEVIKVICFVLPLGTMALFFGKNLHDFSPLDM